MEALFAYMGNRSGNNYMEKQYDRADRGSPLSVRQYRSGNKKYFLNPYAAGG